MVILTPIYRSENLLLTEEEIFGDGDGMLSSPSRFQLHRAPTDNDRMVYNDRNIYTYIAN